MSLTHAAQNEPTDHHGRGVIKRLQVPKRKIDRLLIFLLTAGERQEAPAAWETKPSLR